MRPKAQFLVHQCLRFRDNTNIPHNHAVKRVLKYLKGTATQELIIKPYLEKGIECYIDEDFAVGWNQ